MQKRERDELEQAYGQAGIIMPLAGHALGEGPWSLSEGLSQRDQLVSMALLAESVGRILLAYSKSWNAVLGAKGDEIPWTE